MKPGGRVFAAGFCRLDVGPAEQDYIDCHNEFAQVHSKVSDIAYTIGFNDLSYFHKSFRRRFGVTPADMRTEFDREH